MSYQDVITQAKQEWADANARGDQAGMDTAHQKAEQARATQGYSGGADGSGNYALNNSYSVGGNTYNDPYQSVRSQYQDTGGDVGRAFENAMASGNLDEMKKIYGDRATLMNNSSTYDQNAWNMQNTYAGIIKQLEAQNKQQTDYDSMIASQKRIEQETRDNATKAIQAATDQAVYALENQKNDVNSQADSAGRNAYAEYMKGLNKFGNMGEALNNAGGGGISDYMKVASLNGYQNANATIVSGRDKMLNDIATAIVNARTNGDIQSAKALTEALNRELTNSQWAYGQQSDMNTNNANTYQNLLNSIIANRNTQTQNELLKDQTAYDRGQETYNRNFTEKQYADSLSQYADSRADKQQENSNTNLYNWISYFQSLGYSADKAISEAKRAVGLAA